MNVRFTNAEGGVSYVPSLQQ